MASSACAKLASEHVLMKVGNGGGRIKNRGNKGNGEVKLEWTHEFFKSGDFVVN